MTSVDGPVAFVVFNRPDLTRLSFAAIQAQQPPRLFLIADGPRQGNAADERNCAEVRQIISNIDWPCEVDRNYADTNMGCKVRVATGITSAFRHVDRLIVVEDDCIPHPDFFTFANTLLELYEEEPKVAAITGYNLQQGVIRGSASYYFSRYNIPWGWATWKRVWDSYDPDMSFWWDWRKSTEWRELFPDAVERQYWERIFNRTAAGRIDTWDYQLRASIWRSQGLTATPNVNLVTNAGFRPDATHTIRRVASDGQPSAEMNKIGHPDAIEIDRDADAFVFATHFGGKNLRERRRPVGLFRWLLHRGARALRRAVGAAEDGSRTS